VSNEASHTEQRAKPRLGSPELAKRRMSAGSLGTNLTLQLRQMLSGWYNAWGSVSLTPRLSGLSPYNVLHGW